MAQRDKEKELHFNINIDKEEGTTQKLGVTENHETMISNLYIGGFSLKKKIQQIKNTQ